MKAIILAAVLFSINAHAGSTEYECASISSDEYIVMNPLTEDSIIIDDDEFMVQYDKTEGDVHYTKFRNSNLKQDAFLVVEWGENNQVLRLSMTITPLDSKEVLFEGICTNVVGEVK